MHELQIWFPLIRNKRQVLPCETGIMLNRVVLTQFCQMKTTCPVRTVHEICSKFGRKEAEGGCKVERLPDFDVEFFEGDVLPVVWQYPVVRQRVQHRAGRSRIAILWGNILRPSEVMSWRVWRDDLTGFEGGSEEIENKEGKVPEEDKDFDEETGDFIEDAHIHSFRRIRSHLENSRTSPWI